MVAGFWFFVIRSTGNPLSQRQALQMFRRSQGTGRTGDSGRSPSPGVYRYLTEGSEHLSIGINRAFPAMTSMVVTDGTCTHMEWVPLQEHEEGLVTCPGRDGSVVVTSTSSTEVVAGITTHTTISCPPSAYFLPPDPSVGERWQATCRSAGHPVDLKGQIVGPSTVEVARRPTPALHTRLDFTFVGPETGSNPNDYWIDANSGLVLRQVETVAIAQQAGPLGSVRYGESLSIVLQSTTPLR